MANAGCINAYNCDGCLIQTLQQLDSSNIGVGVQFTAPNPLDDKRLDYIKYTDKCGCSCCLTGENEILIYTTQGTIKSLNLTNNKSSKVVNVKRSEIFGSNRTKTVVRYKTGGYPTSATDGTLAVQETTQNQYSSSGYNVSGLSDGTQYYFTAFALDSSNNVISSKSATITTDSGRSPGPNTIAYYELNGDANDSSGNGHNGTPSNITYTTLTSGIKVASFNGSSSKIQIANPLINSLSNFTINVWLSVNNTSFFGNVVNNQTSAYNGAFIDSYNGNLRVAVGGGDATNYSLNANTRVNAVITYASGSVKEYINGVYYWGETHTYSNGTNMTIGVRGNNNDRRWNGYISKIIIEDKARTADEISEYCNQTKADYGL